MHKILTIIFSLLTVFLLAQIPPKGLAESNHERQLPNEVSGKLITESQRNSRSNSVENLYQLNERFDFNFAEKQKFESKLENLAEKKKSIENKIGKSKSEENSINFKEKLAKVNADIDKLTQKLADNQKHLEALQELYRNLKK